MPILVSVMRLIVKRDRPPDHCCCPVPTSIALLSTITMSKRSCEKTISMFKDKLKLTTQFPFQIESYVQIKQLTKIS